MKQTSCAGVGRGLHVVKMRVTKYTAEGVGRFSWLIKLFNDGL